MVLYPWHGHKDILRYPRYMPQDIAADMAVVISCCIGTGYNGYPVATSRNPTSVRGRKKGVGRLSQGGVWHQGHN